MPESPSRKPRRTALAFAAYLLLAAAYTWPLLGQSGVRIAGDRFDPVLNASILWWNATELPFSNAWWSPPHFYPAEDVAAFTENLAGLGPVSTPLFWLTRQPLLTYNLTFFLTWPLCAIAAYLLAKFLVRREDAAFLAGLLFGFAPYRLSQIGHLQVLAVCWLPVALLGLHRYLLDRRKRWLLLFGSAWLLQSLSNGYYMFFGGVLIGMWIAYFLTSRANRDALGPILVSWGLASVPLAVVMLRYWSIHKRYGLARGINAVMDLSAQPAHWLSVADLNWLWSRYLPGAGAEFNLFPGATPMVLVCAALIVFILRGDTTVPEKRGRRTARIAFLALGVVSLAAVVARVILGPVRPQFLGVAVRISGLWRPLTLLLASGVSVVLLTPPVRRRLRDRSPFAFYLAAALAAGVLACGPELRRGTELLFAPMPYQLLLAAVPGLEGLRAVSRFWMIGALCLAVASAGAFAWLTPSKGGLRAIAFVAACITGLADAWPTRFPMADAPSVWNTVEPRDVPRALIELPLGPEWDAAATFRSVGHRRRVVNGVSGYDPPHYLPLRLGLDARDPSVLLALASFGPFDVVVDRRNDPDGSLTRFVEAIPGVRKGTRDEARSVYEIPAVAVPSPGAPIGSATERTGPGGSLILDLGTVVDVGGVELPGAAGLQNLPRTLAIELSTDGVVWREAWRGGLMGEAVRAAVLSPTDDRIILALQAAPARFVRLIRPAETGSAWPVAGVRALAPAGKLP